MKLKSHFFATARLFLLMSAPVIISGTPGVAAAVAVHSTAPINSNISLPAENLVLVQGYFSMLQALALENKDQDFYDAASMSDQISCSTDEQGNRTYQMVDGKGEEVMQGLNSDQKDFYTIWSNDQTQKEASHVVTSSKKNVEDSLLTPGQIKKANDLNSILNTSTHNPFANNAIDAELIKWAILAAVTALGIKMAAGIALKVITGIAGTCTMAGTFPLGCEGVAHLLEKGARSKYATGNDTVADYFASRLTAIEQKNNGKTLWYMSNTGANFGKAATWCRGWTTYLTNFFKSNKDKIIDDEQHLSWKDYPKPQDQNRREETQVIKIVNDQTRLLAEQAAERAGKTITASYNSTLEGHENLKSVVTSSANAVHEATKAADAELEKQQRLFRSGDRQAIGPADWTDQDKTLVQQIQNSSIKWSTPLDSLNMWQQENCLVEKHTKVQEFKPTSNDSGLEANEIPHSKTPETTRKGWLW